MGIPHHPAGRTIELGDKPLLDSVFAGLQPRISEFTFANLYLFRKAHDYRITMVGDSIVIVGKGYAGGEYFFPPLTGSIEKVSVSLYLTHPYDGALTLNLIGPDGTNVTLLAKGDSNSLTTVPGFTSSGECEEAGQFARKLAKGTIKEVSFVCLKQTKPH